MKSIIILFIMVTSAIGTSINHKNSNYPNDEDNRKKIASDIVTNLVAENYEDVRKDFHSTLKAQLPTEKIAEVWKSVIQTNGIFKKVTSTNTAVTQGYNQVIIRCQFENENASVETTFNEDDKVIGLYIKP